MNTPDFTESRKILKRMRSGKDVFARWDMFRFENNIDVPEAVVKDRKKWGFMLDPDGKEAGFEDAWDLLSQEGEFK
jgi:hypothetical protein